MAITQLLMNYSQPFSISRGKYSKKAIEVFKRTLEQLNFFYKYHMSKMEEQKIMY
jgi:hypothetical protein